MAEKFYSLGENLGDAYSNGFRGADYTSGYRGVSVDVMVDSLPRLFPSINTSQIECTYLGQDDTRKEPRFVQELGRGAALTLSFVTPKESKGPEWDRAFTYIFVEMKSCLHLRITPNLILGEKEVVQLYEMMLSSIGLEGELGIEGVGSEARLFSAGRGLIEIERTGSDDTNLKIGKIHLSGLGRNFGGFVNFAGFSVEQITVAVESLREALERDFILASRQISIRGLTRESYENQREPLNQ